MKFKVPSHEDVSRMKRDLEIYTMMARAKAASSKRSEFRTHTKYVQARFGMKRKKLMAIYKKIGSLMRQSKEITIADKAVAAHKKPTRRKR